MELNPMVKHFFQTNIKEMLRASVLNFHQKGFHSIVLAEYPEKTITLYVCEPGSNVFSPFHPHVTDVTIHCISGIIENIILNPCDDGSIFDIYHYSHLQDGLISPEKTGSGVFKSIASVLKKDDSVFLEAQQIHAIKAIGKSWNCWLVYDGKHDYDYSPIVYSTNKPKSLIINNENASLEELKTILEKAKLI